MILLKSTLVMWNIPHGGKYITHYRKIFSNSSTSDCGAIHFYYQCKKIDLNSVCSYCHSEGTGVLSYLLCDSVSIFYLSKLWGVEWLTDVHNN